MYEQNYEAQDAYFAFQEGTRLLAGDNAHAAVIALERARALEPAQGLGARGARTRYFRTGRSPRPKRSSKQPSTSTR